MDRRHHPGTAYAIHTRLLSSPLLHSLDYSISYFSTTTGLVSDFAYLMKIIAQSPRLQKLRIGIYAKELTFNPELTQFSALPDEIPPVESELAALRSLKLLDRIPKVATADYYKEHQIISSVVWNGCAGIPRTTELALHGLSPRHVLENLEGKAPNLRGLDFPLETLVDYGGNALPRGTGNTQQACEAISSLRGIEELQLSNYDDSYDVIWPAITAHRSTLRLLRIRSTNPRYHGLDQQSPLCYPSPQQLGMLRDSSITHLEIDVSLRAATQAWHPFHRKPQEDGRDPYLACLVELHQLTTLRLCIAVAESSPRFALLANAMAPNIFRAFRAGSSASRLRHLSIYFVKGFTANIISDLGWELRHRLAPDGEYVATLAQSKIRPSVQKEMLARYEWKTKGGDLVSFLPNPHSTWRISEARSDKSVSRDDEIVLDLADLSLGK